MRKEEFEETLQETPVYHPWFRVTRVPDWSRYPIVSLKIGDEGYIDDGGTFVTQTSRYGIGSSYLQFIEYRKE